MARSSGTFAEKAHDEWSLERERILHNKITELGLRIEGTYLEAIVARLYTELAAAGIALRPKVYLSDEWACPDGVPVIGIPFYLADKKLARIEDEMMEGVEASTEQEVLSYLRHEAGHAFNYAHRLYETEPWLAIFGPYSAPYRDDYRAAAVLEELRRHIPGWYAQKHPDEDFSETFAVWLDPNSNWREAYRDWGCYEKLQYVDAIVREYGSKAPLVTGDDYDFASEALVHSIGEHYARARPALLELPAEFDQELRTIFRSDLPGETAEQLRADLFILRHRRHLVARIARWTGLYDVARTLAAESLRHSLRKARPLARSIGCRARTGGSHRLRDRAGDEPPLQGRFRLEVKGAPEMEQTQDHDPLRCVRRRRARGRRGRAGVQGSRPGARKRGYQTKTLAADGDIRKLVGLIEKDDSDLLFNLVDWLADKDTTPSTSRRCSNCSASALPGQAPTGRCSAIDKGLAKKIFSFHGISYPKFSMMVAGQVEWSDELKFPLFVKPSNTDSSIGIDENALVKNIKQLMERISYIHTEIKSPVLIEEFIEGREIFVAVLGNERMEALPILEWDFSKLKGAPKFATAEAKWNKHSAGYKAPEIFPEDIPEDVYKRIQATAVDACKALRVQDYGRVDMRLRQKKNAGEWEWFIIEVNPNPYLEPNAEVALAASKHELDYADLVERIVEHALRRTALRAPP